MSNNKPIRSERFLLPAAPICFAKLVPIIGKYTSLMSLFRTKEDKALGLNSAKRKRLRCSSNTFCFLA